MTDAPRFGFMDLEELLIREGVAAPPEQIRRVLDAADREGQHAVIALVEKGIVVEDVLADLLARAAGTVVVDLDGGVEAGAARLLDPSTARTHLALPVALPANGKMRVAFVNPLDVRAREAVELSCGEKVHSMVGTLSGLRQAIEVAYGQRTTRIAPPPRSEMPPEITQRVRSAEIVSSDTSPIDRLAAQATVEQRHEALLLALVERGVLTHADYLAALRRLLSGRER